MRCILNFVSSSLSNLSSTTPIRPSSRSCQDHQWIAHSPLHCPFLELLVSSLSMGIKLGLPNMDTWVPITLKSAPYPVFSISINGCIICPFAPTQILGDFNSSLSNLTSNTKVSHIVSNFKTFPKLESSCCFHRHNRVHYLYFSWKTSVASCPSSLQSVLHIPSRVNFWKCESDYTISLSKPSKDSHRTCSKILTPSYGPKSLNYLATGAGLCFSKMIKPTYLSHLTCSLNVADAPPTL